MNMDKELIKDLLEKIRTVTWYQALLISGFLFIGIGIFLLTKTYIIHIHSLAKYVLGFIFLVLGLFAVIFVFFPWYFKNQKTIDEMLYIMKEMKNKELDNASAKEMTEKRNEEALFFVKEEAFENSKISEHNEESNQDTMKTILDKSLSSDSKDIKNTLIKVRQDSQDFEDYCYKNLCMQNSIDFQIQREMALPIDRNRRHIFDVLLKNTNKSDFIIEICLNRPTALHFALSSYNDALKTYQEKIKENTKLLIFCLSKHKHNSITPIENNIFIVEINPDLYESKNYENKIFNIQEIIREGKLNA